MFFFCIIVILVFVYFMLKDLHYAVLLYVPVSVLCQDYLCLRFAPPALSLSFVLNTILILYYLFHKKITLKKFPFYKVYIFLFLIQFVGIIVSPSSVMNTLPSVINKIFSYFIVVIFYFELKRKDDLKYSTNVIGGIFLLLCFYNINEFATQENFLLEYIQKTYPDYMSGKLFLSHEYRYISIRCSSLFAICIAWGGFCCLILSFFACIWSIYSLDKKKWIMGVFLLGLASLGVLTSGSRSTYVYFVFPLIILLFSSKFSGKVILGLLILSLIFFNENFFNMLIQSMHSDSDIVSGSSVDGRINQLQTISSVISESPLWGLGIKGLSIAVSNDSEVLGAESIWFQQLITSGLIGIAFQFYIYISVYRVLTSGLHGRKRFIFTIMLIGWVTFSSLTTSPGLKESYFLVIIILLLRYKHILLEGKR